MNRPVLFVIAVLMLWCFPETASAVIAADDMPWSNPLARIVTNLKDVVAPMVIIAAIVVFGLSVAFAESGHAFRRAPTLIIGGSIALGVIALMATFGWSGATF